MNPYLARCIVCLRSYGSTILLILWLFMAPACISAIILADLRGTPFFICFIGAVLGGIPYVAGMFTGLQFLSVICISFFERQYTEAVYTLQETPQQLTEDTPSHHTIHMTPIVEALPQKYSLPHHIVLQLLEAAKQNNQAFQCPICLNNAVPYTKVQISYCGHVYCSDCFHAPILTTCAICRSPLTSETI